MRAKQGKITSNKQNKTLVVTVDTYKSHPKYKKKFKVSKKYYVDNPENKEFKIDDAITIYETKPLSKLKRWTVTQPQKDSRIKEKQS